MPQMKHSDLTKKALTNALKELMAGKPLNKITVQEITSLAGVNRQTFYYHFTDIYDQVKWMYQEEVLVLLTEHEGVLFWQDGLLQLFRYLEMNKEVCLCTLNSLGREHLKNFFYTDISCLIKKVILSFAEELGEHEIDNDYVAFLTHFYTISLGGVMESWLLSEIDKDPEELIRFIDMTLTAQMRGALSEKQS